MARSPSDTLPQGSSAGHHGQGLRPHRRLEGCDARRHHPQGRRRQDAAAHQAHPSGVFGRGRRHRYGHQRCRSRGTGADAVAVQFAEYIQRNAQLYSMRNETDLSPSGLAHFVRGELASSLRSRHPYNVNLLMGGVDPITGKPHLYWLDYLASLAELPYAAHGYAQYVNSGIDPMAGRRTKPWYQRRIADLRTQILLPVHPRQAPPPRHHPRTGHQDSDNVHGRAEEAVTDRLQGHGGQGDQGRWHRRHRV